MIDELQRLTREACWTDASELLYKHWITASQSVFPTLLPKPWEAVADELKIESDVLFPLAAMFCADSPASSFALTESGRPDTSLRHLRESVDIDETKARSGQICGKIFKNGEPNYTCKQCASDSTCVLCYDCFVNSEHANHKYKMHTSMGGGYCDCGDKEAWSSHYACRIHSISASSAEEGVEDEIDRAGLPPRIATRLHRLSLIALKFAVNLLCWNPSDQFPSIIDESHITANQDVFQTVLYNDETHTYDGVIRALTLAIHHCSEANAMRLATIVDREGRSIVASGIREHCEAIKNEIEKRSRKDSNQRTQKSGPLLVKVFRSTLTSLQLLAIRLLGWLAARAQEFPPFATILSESFLFGCPDCQRVAALGRARLGQLERLCDCAHPSHAVYLMIFDRRLWKAARIAFHQLLMSTVLMDLDHKNAFGRLFVRNYNLIFDDFIDDDHEHSVSVTSMTVQIFTVPTVAKRLISEENALHVCIEHLRQFCHNRYMNASPHNEHIKQLSFANDTYPAVLRRAMYSLNDIGYLLTQVPRDGSEWTDALRDGFTNGAHTLLRFLSYMQSMDEVKRQSTEHQLMENEWETAFNIFLRMQEPLSLMLSWARTDPRVHLYLYLRSLRLMLKHSDLSSEFNGSKRVKVEVNGHHAFCISFEVLRGAVSVHQPLWRFLAGLMCAPAHILRLYSIDNSKCDISATAENANQLVEQVLAGEQRINMNGTRTLLMEMPLRVLVLNAQVTAAQLWRRNGFSLLNQVHNYASCLCRTEMFDRDIQMLQVVGATMEPNKFLIRLLDRFGLVKWAAIGFEELSTLPGTIEGTSQEESGKIFSVLAEEFYHLLIILLGERYSVGISEEATPEKALEREIVHILCTGPKPFSQIEKHMPNDPAIQRLPLDTAVRSVSDFKRPISAARGEFHLKDSLRAQYNAFFWHYSKHQLSQAEQQQQKERAGLSRELKACPPPIPPPFAPFFAPLLRIVESDLFVKLLRVVFERVAKRSRFVSEGLFHRALFLTGMALNEQKLAHQRNETFNFFRMAKSEGFFDFLLSLKDKPAAEAHGNLLWFIMHLFNEVSSLYSSTEQIPVGAASSPVLAIVAEEITANKSAQRAAMAAQKRQLAMERMRKLQTSFKSHHPDLVDTSSAGSDGTAAQQQAAPGEHSMNRSSASAIDECEQAVLASDSTGFPVCCGPTKSRVELHPQPSVMCILCQEDECISFDGNEMVCSAFVQNSTLFARQCVSNTAALLPYGRPSHHHSSSSSSSTGGDELLNIFAPIDLPQELHVSTCSHLMHFSCYKQFIDSNNTRERLRRPHILNSRMLNVEANEYLCPLCKRMSNCALPVFPPPAHSLGDVWGFSMDSGNDEGKTNNNNASSTDTFNEWISNLRTLVTHPGAHLTQTSPDKQQHSTGKGHSRKRSYSERTLTELTKSSSLGGTGTQQQSSQQQQQQNGGVAGRDGGPSAGLSRSSVSSLPSALETVPLIELMATEQQQTPPQQQEEQSTRMSIAEAIVGQIRAAESTMLAGGGAAVMQQLLHIFGSKKTPPKDISNTNIPPGIRHWEILKPLLNAFDRTSYNRETSQSVGGASSTAQPKESLPFARLNELLNVLRSCSFVVRSLAHTLEAEKKPLFGAFNTRQRDCLTAFVRLAMVMPFNCQPNALRVLVMHWLTPLLTAPASAKEDTATAVAGVSSTGGTPAGTSKPGTPLSSSSSTSQQSKSPLLIQLEHALCIEVGIMQIDMLTLAVELVMCIGWTWVLGNRVLHGMHEAETVWKVADGSVDELFVIRLTLLAHLFQIVELHEPEYDVTSSSSSAPVSTSDQDYVPQQPQYNVTDFGDTMETLRRLFPHYHLWKWSHQSEHALFERLHQAVISFLRPLAILYSAVTLVPPPESLKDPSLDSFVSLCRFLGLPSTLSELLAGAQVEELFQMWSMHLPQQRFKQCHGDQLIGLHLPLRLNLLIDLPEDYSQLINKTVNFRCPEVNELTNTIPTLCLNCGQMLCSQGYCCQKVINGRNVGACTAHLNKCRSSSGIFLRIRECQIICLLATNGGELTRGCFKSAPYVDEFGETDPGFRRGNPMHLNRELYWKIQRLWLHQEIAEEIINQYELNYRNIAVEWNNF